MDPVIELDGLEVRFGRRPILRRLEARLGGRAIGLLGPNGAGKTTLIHTLLGFHRPAAGTARVLGRNVATEPAAVRELLGYMPENDAFVAGLSAVRFVTMMAELSGLPPRPALERAHEALFFVGLGEARYRPLGSYSQGMKQLAKLAQAIVHGPRLLLLDEPTNALDPPARERMLRLVADLRDRGDTRILFSSHLLHDVERTCDEVLVLRDGAIVAQRDLSAERDSDRRLLEIELGVVADAADAADATDAADAVQGFSAALAALGAECAVGGGNGTGGGAGGRGRRRLKAVLPAGLEVADVYRLAAERGAVIRRLAFRRDSLEEIFLAAMDAPAGGAAGGAAGDGDGAGRSREVQR